MVTAARWIFQETDTKWGGASSAAFANPLSGSGLDRAETLAREAIQNSVDAFDPSGSYSKPRMVFRFRDLEGKARTDLVHTLFPAIDWGIRHEHQEFRKLGFDHILDESAPLRLLFLEDYGTHGLYGDPSRPTSTSHLRRLMLELGNDAKAARESNSGGSYGYGKSVYLVSGRHRLFLAHSMFDPSNDNSGAYSRLLGVGYFPEHQLNGTLLSGKAVFANSDVGGSWRPFQDEEASEMARRLGFQSRGIGAEGTSILIISPDVSIDEMRWAIEKWWWPRIISDRLDISLIDNDIEQDPPRPRKRSMLKPYVDCFDMLRGRSGSMSRSDQKVEELTFLQEPLGKLALQLSREPDPDANDDEFPDDKLGEIALFRAPEMVVRYLKVNRLNGACVGVFEAAPTLDNALRLSENPAHTAWDPNTTRLGDDDKARRQIRRVPQDIGRAARVFARSATPPVPPSGLRVPAIENLLGRAIRIPRPGSLGGGNPAAPIRMTNLRTERCFHNDLLYTEGSVRLRLSETFNGDAATCSVHIDCHPVEDSGVSEDTPIPVGILTVDGTPLMQDQDGRVQLRIGKDSDAVIRFRTADYSRDWSIRIVPQARIVQNGVL
jgi:hypothetical protein